MSPVYEEEETHSYANLGPYPGEGKGLHSIATRRHEGGTPESTKERKDESVLT